MLKRGLLIGNPDATESATLKASLLLPQRFSLPALPAERIDALCKVARRRQKHHCCQ
ncbi:MAG: hypothetical protein MZV64_18450 [Ignavibacteriales bacterium]|nr:hypothetical protein [Ignavibacteriales bacterium]